VALLLVRAIFGRQDDVAQPLAFAVMRVDERLSIDPGLAGDHALDIADNLDDAIRRRNLIAAATMSAVAMSQQPTRFTR
jgi:hypothetical protein